MGFKSSSMENLAIVNKKFWENKTILVTGHTGFKGSWLSFWLEKLGAMVWGISLSPENQNSLYERLIVCNKNLFGSNNIQSIIHDIRDFEKIHKTVEFIQPDIVFHLAAQPLVSIGYQRPRYTWDVNIKGTINLLESIKVLNKFCSVIVTTTDKVYLNREWDHGYRECDTLGGHDPYSASKAATELLVESWRLSFCGNHSYQKDNINIATARSGNVIGGGDWTKGRIIPDIVSSIKTKSNIKLRNPESTRPWQHVLEPLNGYLLLAEYLYKSRTKEACQFNFGPEISSNIKVKDIVEYGTRNSKISWVNENNVNSPHEANLLYLSSDKAKNVLKWSSKWNLFQTLDKTFKWYEDFDNGLSALDCCIKDLDDFTK